MNAKLRKIINAIEKTEQVINVNQEKLKKLYQEKDEIENLEMINVLKKHKIRPSDLKNIVDSLHKDKGDIIPLKTQSKEGDKNESN